MVEQILHDWCDAGCGTRRRSRCVTSIRSARIESGTIGEDPHDVPNNLFPFITQVAIGKLRQADGLGQRLADT